MKETVPPAAMLRRWTRDEYDRRVELGAFEDGERVELIVKTSLYARAAVPECWIIDVARGLVEVHRDPQPSDIARYGWRYAGIATLWPPATITPLVAPATRIAIAVS